MERRPHRTRSAGQTWIDQGGSGYMSKVVLFRLECFKAWLRQGVGQGEGLSVGAGQSARCGELLVTAALRFSTAARHPACRVLRALLPASGAVQGTHQLATRHVRYSDPGSK